MRYPIPVPIPKHDSGFYNLIHVPISDYLPPHTLPIYRTGPPLGVRIIALQVGELSPLFFLNLRTKQIPKKKKIQSFPKDTKERKYLKEKSQKGKTYEYQSISSKLSPQYLNKFENK